MKIGSRHLCEILSSGQYVVYTVSCGFEYEDIAVIDVYVYCSCVDGASSCTAAPQNPVDLAWSCLVGERDDDVACIAGKSHTSQKR